MCPDGKSVGGTRCLTDKVVDRIQTYYGYAIRNNKGNEGNMVRAIWDIFYHMMIRPPDESAAAQHLYCPDGNDSWCKYKKDHAFNTNSYDRTKCLPFVFRKELKPIFDRLQSCKKGLTQNQNEAVNNVLWSKCLKRVFVGRDRFTIAACDAITKFNDRARSTKSLFEKLNLKCGTNTSHALNFENKLRLQNSALKATTKYRIQRQKLRSQQNNKGKDDTLRWFYSIKSLNFQNLDYTSI